jgi:hypothetical protein
MMQIKILIEFIVPEAKNKTFHSETNRFYFEEFIHLIR